LQETEKMSYWDGDRWVDPAATPRIVSSRRANWAATAVMLIGVVALMLPFGSSFAATRKSAPSLYVGCNTACVVGGSLAVRGTGFTPSSGGQQVMLWVEYPADYCAGSTCHGFYYNPWVNDDGTFSHTFDSAILQAGTGGVEAIQYNARTDKWVKVAYVDYSTR
jgi:hypothetical protein